MGNVTEFDILSFVLSPCMPEILLLQVYQQRVRFRAQEQFIYKSSLETLRI
jgi:hypothetical protein